MKKKEAISKRNTRLRAELEAALERVRSVEAKNKQLEEELLRQERLAYNLSEQNDRDTETIGILADVVDILFEDEDRCATRSYDEVREKARELVGLKGELAELREAERFVLCVWCGEEICAGGTITPEDVLERCRAHDENCEAHPLGKQLRAIPREMARLEFWPVRLQSAVAPLLPDIVARSVDAARFSILVREKRTETDGLEEERPSVCTFGAPNCPGERGFGIDSVAVGKLCAAHETIEARRALEKSRQ
ncbi:MAG: hypothetical protein ABFD77_02635 [Thermotogota bacterium]